MRARHSGWCITAWALLAAACVPSTPADTDPPDETDAEPALTDTEPVDSEPLIDPCDPSLETSVEFGLGEYTFVELVDGQTVALEQGGQDPPGYHIWGSVRLRHSSQFRNFRYTLTDVPSGLVVGSYRFNVALTPIPEDQPWACVGRYVGMRGVLNDWIQVRTAADMPDTAAISEVFCGTDMRLDLALLEGETEVLTQSVTVTVQPDPDVAPPCDSPAR